jgi:uncharacterized protein (DUF2336 family)
MKIESFRQSIRQLLNEEVYGTIATVYHGSKQPPEEFIKVFEDESGKVGWQVSKGAGSSYGHGLYTVWMQTGHQTFSGGYGNWIYKFKVNLNGFIIFDDAVCRKVYGSSITPLEQLERLGKKDVIQRLSDRIKSLLSQAPVKDEHSSSVAREVSNYLAGVVNGIIFFGGNDGPVVLVYDPNIVTPMAYAKLKDAKSGVWTKWNPEEIRHSRARSAQAGTYADPERLQKSDLHNDPDQIIKKIDKLISSGNSKQTIELLNKLNTISKTSIAQRSDISADLVQKLANDTEVIVRVFIAMRPNLSDDLIRKLANDTDRSVREKIAGRQDISDDLIRKLANDTDGHVRGKIAGRRDISDDLMRKFANDTDWNVRRFVASNLGLSIDLVQKFANDKNEWVRANIADRKDLSDDLIRKLAGDKKKEVREQIAKRPDLSDDLIRKLANDVNTEIRYYISTRQDLSIDLVQKFVDDTKALVRGHIAKNASLSDDMVRKLANDKISNVRYSILTRENLSDEVLKILAKDKNPTIKNKAKELLQSRAANKLDEMKLRNLIMMMIS